jgi:hypothetical protein
VILKLLAEQLQSPESWARRVSQSIETASQFSWANTARNLLAVYKTIT